MTLTIQQRNSKEFKDYLANFDRCPRRLCCIKHMYCKMESARKTGGTMCSLCGTCFGYLLGIEKTPD